MINNLRPSPRSDWSQILAYAWTQTDNSQNSKVLDDLRKDPKGTIIKLAEGSSEYPNVDEDTKSAAKSIQEQAETSPELNGIRQDPLNNLLHQDELLKIFPLPDRPRGLDRLTIEDLESFFDDEDNARHLSGIFLIGS